MSHTLSVIVCAYTEARWHDLVAVVVSLQEQTLSAHEIIVAVDHNPALADRVRHEMSGVIVVENDGVRGLASTRNVGVAVASGSITVFVDDDAVAEPGWLAQISATFDEPAVIGVGGAIEPAWGCGRPAWFPDEFDWVVGCTYRGMPEQIAPVRNLIGCNMAFRREAFDTVGGFRIGRVGELSIGQENDETEFCIRLSAARPADILLYQPSARVRHKVSPNRATPRYFARRCFSEGVSKATLSGQVGSGRGLATERDYTLRTLPKGVRRGIGDIALRRDPAGLLRALMIVAGLLITVAGYLTGYFVPVLTHR